jgi:4,5-DOPA dioxygenase extradiol
MMKYPAVFLAHGGGPMPLLGMQPDIAQHLTAVRQKWLPPDVLPSAIVVVSAHWESDPIRIIASAQPSMIYDYYGFPPKAYELKYPAPGSPILANKIHTLLSNANIPSVLDTQRGYDHGVYVPLMLMYPEAEIPVVEVSLHADLTPQSNLRLGAALRSLRDENVLLVGSGYSFHNMSAFMRPSADASLAARAFNDWLKESMLMGDSRSAKLLAWETAPSARFCHPREEHLAPLFVVAGAVGDDAKAVLIFDAPGDLACSSYLFQ